MDTVTQAALGATVGQAFFARKLGRKANWWGALGGLVPDFDVFLGPFVGEWGNLIWHRGPTHALWFGPLLGPLLGWLTWRFYRKKARRAAARAQGPPDVGVGPKTADHRPPDAGADDALPAWIGLWMLALLTHPLLDAFTTYGTQLLAPFDLTRFSWDGVSIIDPLYTGVLALALIVGWRSRRRPVRAMRAAQIALLWTTAYLGYGYLQNERARDLAREQLAEAPMWVDAYPTFFQPWFRRVVAWYPDEVRIGYLSTLAPRPIEWTRVERGAHPAIDALSRHPNAEVFRWFANDRLIGFTTPDPRGTRVELEDFRFSYPHRPERALWGIRAIVGPDGAIVEGPKRYRSPPPESVADGLRHIWRGTFPR